jgi:hypothetical protein
MTDIFDPKGRVNNIDPATIPVERRSQYVALCAAQIMCEQADADLKIADDAVAAAVRTHDKAYAALPRSTFLQEARAAAASFQRGR